MRWQRRGCGRRLCSGDEPAASSALTLAPSNGGEEAHLRDGDERGMPLLPVGVGHEHRQQRARRGRHGVCAQAERDAVQALLPEIEELALACRGKDRVQSPGQGRSRNETSIAQSQTARPCLRQGQGAAGRLGTATRPGAAAQPEGARSPTPPPLETK